MRDERSFQIHANVNHDGNDSGLRVTITLYDETGHSVAHKTWRKHVRGLWMESMEWQAYAGLTDLCKMMAEVCGEKLIMDEPDEPMF
jgi:hypothetical protein